MSTPPGEGKNPEPAAYAGLVDTAWSMIDGLQRKYANGNRALGWLAQKRWQKAQSCIEQALNIDPTGWRALWARGKLLRTIGEHVQAWPLYERALDNSSKDVGLLRDAVAIALYRGDAQLGQRLAREAIQASPNDPELMCLYGLALTLGGDGRRALGVVTNAWKLDQRRDATMDVMHYIRSIVNGQEPCPECMEV